MEDLLSSHAIPGRAYLRACTEVCRPFLIIPRHGKSVRLVKMNVCVFVCFITKAFHLELVSDLSIDAFLASFKLFIGRKGNPVEIFSDCVTNLVGTKHVLKLWSSEAIGWYLANESVVWRTNVPSSPHFGGLWEPSVKSMKYHLKRVIGCRILTYEEFSTFLVVTEAVLNSRPLVVASEDPEEFH
ncbi:uncharacterized protein LOC129980673 [Argiope bruennichi]|uniref:uncharacterized protein LOC129980673 n=1 Tax=Argiope bruennichi TaxID=94029 RepID=UPI0024954449|nr:uncharacterized protein LOC129980673 [Argiope bruennichi]